MEKFEEPSSEDNVENPVTVPVYNCSSCRKKARDNCKAERLIPVYFKRS